MKKSKATTKKPETTSTSSRRKFLGGLGVVAAVAAVAPTLKTMKAIRGNKAAAKRPGAKRPAFLAGMRRLKPVSKISRPAGTSKLPLEARPV